MLIALALSSGRLLAAAGDDFYQRLFDRGVAHYNAGDYVSAYSELRIAGFGLVDSIEQFETAEVYVALTARKLGHEADERSAMQRIIAAEKVAPHYRSLPLRQDLRADFESAAKPLLLSEDLVLLGIAAQAPRKQVLAESSMPPQTAPEPKSVATPTIVSDPPPSIVPQTMPSAPAPQPKSSSPSPRTNPPPNWIDPGTTQPRAAPPQPTQPQPAAPQPAPRAPAPAPQPRNDDPRPQTRAPQPATTNPAQSPPAASAVKITNLDASLGEAQKAIASGDLDRARSIYQAALDLPQLAHPHALRIAEGLYRTRDFANAVRAFQRAGALNHGEEPFGYYKAVALYETGSYADAKRALAAALPFIEITPDVSRYRVKIEGAID